MRTAIDAGVEIATHDLAAAFNALFRGQGGIAEAEVVLTYLAARSGYYQISNPTDHSVESIWYNEGRRSLFAEIRNLLNLTADELEEIEFAARRITRAYADD